MLNKRFRLVESQYVTIFKISVMATTPSFAESREQETGAIDIVKNKNPLLQISQRELSAKLLEWQYGRLQKLLRALSCTNPIKDTSESLNDISSSLKIEVVGNIQ